MGFDMSVQEKPRVQAMSVLVYGRDKTNKTSFFRSWPEPVFVALSEHGTQFVTGVPCPRVRNRAELAQFVTELLNGRKAGQEPWASLKTVVLDDLSVFAEQEAAQLEAEFQAKNQRYRGEQIYGQLTSEIMRQINRILQAGLHVGVTAHARVGTDDGKIDNFELKPHQQRTHIHPKFNRALSEAIAGNFSFILYAYTDKTGSRKALTKRVSTVTQLVEAGDRTGTLPKVVDITGKPNQPETSGAEFLTQLRNYVRTFNQSQEEAHAPGNGGDKSHPDRPEQRSFENPGSGESVAVPHH